MPKHILTADQFSENEIFHLFELTDHMRGGRYPQKPLDGKLIGLLFMEPSIRTMTSFSAAIKRLGGDAIEWSGKQGTSMEKGESLEDTIKTVSLYVDAIVLRSGEEGAMAKAAAVSEVPIINAGDGDGEHPTQALLDLYTIADERSTSFYLKRIHKEGRFIHKEGRLNHKDIEGLTIFFFGDNKYARTVHSLKKLLGLFEGVNVLEENLYFDMESEPADRVWDKENYVINLGQADVVYLTRLQKERWPEGWHDVLFASPFARYPRNEDPKYPQISKGIHFGMDDLAWMKKDAIILHPLPRTAEMQPAVDADKRCKIWQQAKNGMFLRMALLHSLLS